MQKSYLSIRWFWCTAGILLPLTSAVGATPAEDFFETKVRPVFAKNCYACHTAAQTSGLRVDSRDALLKGGTRGPAIVPGKPEESLLVKAIHYSDSRLRMPPPSELAAEDVRAIEQWIQDGAPWPDKAPTAAPVITDKQRAFWSLQKVVKPEIPANKNTAWAHNDIDRFVLAKLEDKKLVPAKDADKRILARRVTLDLTGLPPTPDEIQKFLADKSPQAYEHLIDRLLASKAYGERWGRMWLDVVRFADTAGDGADYPVPDSYKYRDWVIQSYIEDKPYDQFVREQIAGDLLPSTSEPDHWNKIIATGYLANARRSGRKVDTVSDAVDNLGYSFLGLSVACARCHDHKFDPIPTRDYYAMFGILNSTKFAAPGSEPIRYQRDMVYRDPNATKSQEYLDFQAQLKPIADSIAAINRLPYFDDILPMLDARRMDLYKRAPHFETAYAVAEDKPANAHVLPYGDPSNPAEEVDRGFLQILGGQKLPPGATGSGRLDLANWIASADNPLTARVMVNRIWQGHFGRGIVPTPNDFGSRGTAPTHPELLDYLAARFVENGWSVKAMHKEILLSHTYQVSSERVEADAAIDADNIYMWRQARRRMDAEQVRDAMLAVSGTLDTTPAGPQPFPAEWEWNYSAHVPFSAVYDTNKRSVYLMVQRIRQHPYLGLFDAPDANASTGVRSSNITSLQALFFMNGELPRKCAENLATALEKDYPSMTAKLDRVFWSVYNRAPSPRDKDRAQTFLTKAEAVYKAKGASDSEGQQKAMAAFIEALFSTNEFLFVE